MSRLSISLWMRSLLLLKDWQLKETIRSLCAIVVRLGQRYMFPNVWPINVCLNMSLRSLGLQNFLTNILLGICCMFESAQSRAAHLSLQLNTHWPQPPVFVWSVWDGSQLSPYFSTNQTTSWSEARISILNVTCQHKISCCSIILPHST